MNWLWRQISTEWPDTEEVPTPSQNESGRTSPAGAPSETHQKTIPAPTPTNQPTGHSPSVASLPSYLWNALSFASSPSGSTMYLNPPKEPKKQTPTETPYHSTRNSLNEHQFEKIPIIQKKEMKRLMSWDRPTVQLKGTTSDLHLVMNIELSESLRPFLPGSLQEANEWELIYSIEKNGISLHTLYQLCEGQGPMLLAIRDTEDSIFGAFCSEELHYSLGYFGSGECFLWKQDHGKTCVYPAVGKNDYLTLCNWEFIAFGGGDGQFGLWIDSELFHGHSGECQTYQNPILSKMSEFKCMALEIWKFCM